MVLVSKAGSQRVLCSPLVVNSDGEPGIGAIIARTLAAVATRYAKALSSFAVRLEGEMPDSEIQRQLHVIGELRDTWEKLLSTAIPQLADKCSPPVLLSNCAGLGLDGKEPQPPA